MPRAIPLLGANLGAWFAVLSILYWIPADAAVASVVAALTLVWARLPFSPWGPGHGWLAGWALPIFALGAVEGLTRLARVYYHEHADFLKGGPPVRAFLDEAHAWLWAPFHFGILAFVDAGGRPRAKAALARDEQVTLRTREHVRWVNWARLAWCEAQLVCTPQDVDGLVEAVREARSRGLRIRVVASGFSWSSLVPSGDALLFCERLNRITVDVSDPTQPTVWAEAGVTNRQLNRELERHGLCMPWNVVLETVRVAGIASTGTHGTGRSTATVGDLVLELEVVDARGRLRVLSEATVGAEVMSGVRLGLGAFGVIVRVKLRVVPIYRVCQTDHRMPASAMLDRLPQFVATHDSVELYWFPFNRDVWVRTIDRTDAPRTSRSHGFWFRASNLFQNFAAIVFFKFITRLVPAITPALLRVGMSMLPFRSRVLNLPESHHYHHWIELMPCGCLEVGFKADPDFANVHRAWQTTTRLVDEYAERGLYPLNISLNVRFIGASGALLTPAYGEGITCYVEVMWMGRPEGWAEFSSDLCREWLEVPGALPHWSKEFEHVPGVIPIVRASLGSRLDRFLAALAHSDVDPERVFWNPLLHRLLVDDPDRP